MQNKEYKHIRAYRCGAVLAVADRLFTMPYLRHWADKTTAGVEAKGLEHVTPDKGHLFLTNHRDIVLDPAWLTWILRTRLDIRPYIAMGNNLFGRWWIEPFVRLNRAFVVIRDGGLHEQLEHSRTLSQYIRDRIEEKHSVWMAQREGRAKDSNDLTQPAVLKMLIMSANGTDDVEALKALNICPVSLSYEYDPCDYLKAAEMQLKRDNPDWHKSPEDDIRSMRTGIEGYKGRVVFHFTPSINPWLDQQHEALNAMTRQERLQAIAHRIDWQIHSHYEVFDRGTDFETYLQERLQQIDLPNKDEAFLMDRLREMYNNPVVNYEKSHLSGEF